MNIEIDFDVFKALTARRKNEHHTYNHVLRELLGLGQPVSANASETGDLGKKEGAGRRSFHSRDLILPHGTQLRAIYKGHTYWAKIEDGRWIDLTGVEHRSPSAAAKDITGNNVNGLRFWQAKRPTDPDWYSLDVLALLS